jgi:hypothetical protein
MFKDVINLISFISGAMIAAVLIEKTTTKELRNELRDKEEELRAAKHGIGMINAMNGEQLMTLLANKLVEEEITEEKRQRQSDVRLQLRRSLDRDHRVPKNDVLNREDHEDRSNPSLRGS